MTTDTQTTPLVKAVTDRARENKFLPARSILLHDASAVLLSHGNEHPFQEYGDDPVFQIDGYMLDMLFKSLDLPNMKIGEHTYKSKDGTLKTGASYIRDETLKVYRGVYISDSNYRINALFAKVSPGQIEILAACAPDKGGGEEWAEHYTACGSFTVQWQA